MIKYFVDAARLAETFRTLVSIDSVSRHEGRICRAILSMMPPIIEKTFIDGAGEPTGSDTGNLILKIKGNRDAVPMMLNAHMDTVEPGVGVKPRYADGVFTSSGDTVLGADDKSAIAIIIEVLRVIHERNLPHGPIDVVFTICEEIGLLGAKHLDFGLVDATFGYALDTYDTKGIVTRAPAANRFEIRVHGRSAHAGADPEKGISAVWVASKAVAGLRLGRIDEETTCNIGEMEAKGATNIVPALVRLRAAHPPFLHHDLGPGRFRPDRPDDLPVRPGLRLPDHLLRPLRQRGDHGRSGGGEGRFPDPSQSVGRGLHPVPAD